METFEPLKLTQQEHDELFAAIKSGEYKLDNTLRGVEATMTAILGRMATYSGKVITWDEAMKMDHSLVPELHSFNDPAPVLPNSKGEYPVPIPGITNFR